MNTIIKKIDAEQIKDDDFQQAGEILREGGLVAFPTETVYGLGADALNSQAAAKIYAAKGRPSDNPLIVHIADTEDLKRIAAKIPEKAGILAEAFWPGPLTMIFPKTDAVPYGTTGGLDTVAVRMPNHKIALELIRQSGVLIAAPSANTSGRPSPTRAEHVRKDMDGRIDMIIDGGKVGIGIESTIVDMTAEPPMILRPGYITKEMLEEKIGRVTVDKVVTAKAVTEIKTDHYVPKAPGMKYKHYAPKADLVLVDGESGAVVEKINALAQEMEAQGKKVGIIATDETEKYYKTGEILSIGARDDEDAIARHLYRILREFDDMDVEQIYSESFETPRIGQAIMNRLLKAAGHQVIHV